MSAPPARPRKTSATHSWVTRPKTAIASPQDAAAHMIASPCRCTREAQPLVSEAISAPTAGRGVEEPQHLGPAVLRGDRREERDRHPEEHRDHVDAVAPQELLPAPGVLHPLDDALDARGNRVRRRRYRTHEREGEDRRPVGGDVDTVGRRQADRRDEYPPTAGPAIMPNSPRSESSAEAAVSSSRVTRRGSIASSAGRWKPSIAAISGVTTKSTQTFGSSRSELKKRIAVASPSASSASCSMRLRSTASAKAPPMNAVKRSGTARRG